MFWVTDGFDDLRNEDQNSFYCPNGHSLSYKGESDAQKLARVTKEKNEEIYLLREELRKRALKKRR